jgi:[ribosomal protein S5]-alanine N-acetyltransferase
LPPPPTERLLFRRWGETDAPLADALWCDEQVTHFFGGAMTPEQARARMDAERVREVRLGVQYWPMFLRETGDFAGCAGLRPWQFDPQTMEAGVHLMPTAWGQRLGEEALRAVLTYSFERLGLPAIVAGHGVGHDHSQKLLERVGFRYTHSAPWGPKAIEVLLYAIDAAAWRKLSHGYRDLVSIVSGTENE